MNKKLALFLSGVMALSMLTGCSPEEGAQSDSPVQTVGEEKNTSDAESEEKKDEETAEAVSNEDIVTIEFYGVDMSGTNDMTDIAAAVNEISEEKIGVHVNFNVLDFGSFLQQVSLKMAGNETIDLMLYTPAPPATFSSMTSQNQLQDMRQLLEEYAPDALEAVGDFIKGTSIDGSIYGIPTKSGFATNAYVIMRKDILDALGLTEKAENMTTWTEYEEILEAVAAANEDGTLPEELRTVTYVSNSNISGGILPLGSFYAGDDSWENAYGVDVLGDSYNIISVDPKTDTVSPYYENEDYFKMISRVRSWYEKGWVYKDAAITEDTGDTLIANGVTFSVFATGQVGIDRVREASTGYEVVATEMLKIPMGSSVSQTFGMCIPITAKEPEAAAKFMNLLYSDAEIMNLLTWGIEGRDYTVNEEGEAVKAENAVYSSNVYLWGNGMLTYPSEGLGGDHMERLAQADADAQISKYLGFAADTSAITNELTAINNVINQYRKNIESGASESLEADYEAYCAAMEAAGVQKVIDLYQEQLNAWLGK